MAIYNYDKTTYSQLSNVPGFSYSRSGTAYQQNASGVWTSFDENVPPINAGVGLGVWEARTNSIRNPTGLGAVVGTPGTLPTNWQSSLAAGLSYEIVGVGVEFGLPYVDIRIYGTPTAGTASILFFETAIGIAATIGQTWSASVSTKLTGGSVSNFSSVQHRVELRDAGSGFLTSVGFGTGLSLTSSLTRVSAEYTIATTNTAHYRPGIWAYHAAATPVDVTIRIAAPNLKLGADINDPAILQTNNAASTRGAPSAYLNAPGLLVPPYTVQVWAQLPAIDGTGRVLASISDGTNTNRLQLERNSGNAAVLQVNGGTGGGPAPFAGKSGARLLKMALRVRATELALACDGAPPNSASGVTLPPNLSVVRLGASPVNAIFVNGDLTRFQIINRDISDSELQALTI